MARGIKDKVAILGMGCSKFGERWDSGAEELMLEAYKECIADAGIDVKQLNAAWFSTAIDEVHVGKSGIPLSTTLRLPNIPVTHVENMCAGGFVHVFEKKRLGEERVDEMRKALWECLNILEVSDRDNHVGAKQLDDLFRFLHAVHQHYRIESPAPQRVCEPHRLAKGFTVAGVNRPGDAQWPVTDINA